MRVLCGYVMAEHSSCFWLESTDDIWRPEYEGRCFLFHVQSSVFIRPVGLVPVYSMLEKSGRCLILADLLLLFVHAGHLGLVLVCMAWHFQQDPS